MPRPDRVSTPAEFIATMRALRDWARLTYSELESRAQAAGDRLPRSTIATALSRNRVPRESTIASFVRACGGDRHAVEVWLAARRRITAADEAVGDLAYAVEAWLRTRARNAPGRGGSRSANNPATKPAAKPTAKFSTASNVKPVRKPAKPAATPEESLEKAVEKVVQTIVEKTGEQQVVPPKQLPPAQAPEPPVVEPPANLPALRPVAPPTGFPPHPPANLPAPLPVHVPIVMPAQRGYPTPPAELDIVDVTAVPDGFGASRNYTEGRLARAAAQAKGDRWIGVHRRVEPDRPRRWRGLVRRLKPQRAGVTDPPPHSEPVDPLGFGRPATNP